VAAVDRQAEGLAVALRTETEIAPLLAQVVGGGGLVEEVRKGKPTLEEAFLIYWRQPHDRGYRRRHVKEWHELFLTPRSSWRDGPWAALMSLAIFGIFCAAVQRHVARLDLDVFWVVFVTSF
jgi:hypothetical protein